MRRLQALGLAQRIVLVVALAAVLRVIGIYLLTARVDFLSLVLIAVWAAASVWLLGDFGRSE